MNVGNRIIFSVFVFSVLVVSTMTFVFAQSGDDCDEDADSFTLIDPIDDDSGIDLYDSDTFSFLLEEEKQTVNLYNPDGADILDFETSQNSSMIQDLSLTTLDFMSSVDFETRKKANNGYSQFVEPPEMNGYNFVVVEYHQEIPENKKFNKLQAYYKVYLNDDYVGDTNKGPWIEHFKFFAYNLEESARYKIRMEKMVAAKGSNNFKPVALKRYQPDDYIEDVTLVNDEPNKIIFMLIVWRVNRNGVYEAVVKTEEKGNKYLKRTSSLWNQVRNLYVNSSY